MGAAPALAPIIAGMVADTIDWRTIFIVLALALLFALVFAAMSFENVLETENKKFDIVSFALSAITFCGLTLGIGNIASFGITSMQAVLPTVLGAIGSVLFVYRQFANCKINLNT